MTLGGPVTVYYLNEEGTRVKISMGKPTSGVMRYL